VRLVSLLYGINCAAALSLPQPRLLHVFGWLLMSAGFFVMGRVPDAVRARPFERRFRDGRWTVGHGLLLTAVMCLFVDLLRRKLLA